MSSSCSDTSTNTSKIHYRNLSSRMPNPSFNQYLPHLLPHLEATEHPQVLNEIIHGEKVSLLVQLHLHAYPFRGGHPILTVPSLLFPENAQPGSQKFVAGSDLMAHLARVPTFLRFAFRFTLFALYSVVVGPWSSSSVDIPHTAAEKRGGGGRKGRSSISVVK